MNQTDGLWQSIIQLFDLALLIEPDGAVGHQDALGVGEHMVGNAFRNAIDELPGKDGIIVFQEFRLIGRRLALPVLKESNRIGHVAPRRRPFPSEHGFQERAGVLLHQCLVLGPGYRIAALPGNQSRRACLPKVHRVAPLAIGTAPLTDEHLPVQPRTAKAAPGVALDEALGENAAAGAVSGTFPQDDVPLTHKLALQL